MKIRREQVESLQNPPFLQDTPFMRTQTKRRFAAWTRQLFRAGLLVALVPAAAAAAAPKHWAGAPVDFNREVLPILSENCFACHGMDRNKRMAGLRLDTPEALQPLPSGQIAVVPGNLK